MIICAPDMSVEIASRLGVEPCVLATFPRRPTTAHNMKILVDVGLTRARQGFAASEYIIYVKNTKPTWAIAPDKFGDFRTTLAQWFRNSSTISKYSAPIFVAQEFYRSHVLDAVLDLQRMKVIERVALPMRQHPDVSCSARPRLCAERAERTLRILCGTVSHVHLLGPPLRVVRMLRSALVQCERQGSAVSFDTTAYKRAANNALKQQLGGRWMPRNSVEASMMLEAWLRQALL